MTAMRYAGTLAEWNDERGFGFVQADVGGDRLFVHISSFVPRPSADQRPQVGLRLEFEVGQEKGRKRALSVRWKSTATAPAAHQHRTRAAGPSESASRRSSAPVKAARGGGETYWALLAFLVIGVLTAWFWKVSGWVLVWYGAWSAATFIAYAIDKAAAQNGRWRTQESTLHSMALAGGWPGALLAQQLLRHKSRKAEFRAVFWMTAIVNVGAFVWLHSPYGRGVLQKLPELMR